MPRLTIGLICPRHLSGALTLRIDPTLDVQLVRAIREGTAALPGDLDRLCAYMSLIAGLLRIPIVNAPGAEVAGSAIADLGLVADETAAFIITGDGS